MFVPRNYEQILTGMIAHVRANTTLTDFTIGSVIRTMLEASSLEDDEQYFQMVQLLDNFRIQTARGSALDERAADLNLIRLSASVAAGSVYFRNEGLVTSTMLFDVIAGAAITLSFEDTSEFPAAPFNVRIGEATPNVEDAAVTLNDTVANTLIIGVLVNDHSAGARVSEITGGDKTINSGQSVQVPAAGINAAISFTSIDTAIVVEGNYESGPARIKAAAAGKTGNTSAGSITQFQGSPPFVGAGVISKSNTQGGRDDETDEEFRARLIRRFGELSRGTPFAIESAVIGVEDLNTGQRVATARLREDYDDPFNHILYIDDGTGFVPDRASMGNSTLNGVHGIGSPILTLNDASGFPDSGELLIGPGEVLPEHNSYSSKTGNVLNLDAVTTTGHLDASEVLIVDFVATAEEGQNFFRLADYPVVKNTLELYDDMGGPFTQRSNGVDYVFNRTNGEIQYLGTGRASGTKVLAHHTYYTGLVQTVQHVVNGDPDDRVLYPGVAAGGVIINVGTPIIRRVSVTVSISAQTGFDESELRNDVQNEIEAYIDGLNIGDNVIRARIIEKSMKITGIENIIVQTPVNDVIILENELPVPFDSSGNTLVTVL